MRAWILVSLLTVFGTAACERARPSDRRSEPPAPAPKPAGLTHTAVSGTVHMLVGKGGNIGVSVGPDGVLIVDDQFAGEAPAIRQALGKLSDRRLVYVLNTHHHRDHTGTNPEFGGSATLVAHENVRKRLVDKGMEQVGLPRITFSSAMSLFFNGEEIRLLHLPGGHTDGDTAVYFTGSKVLHAGDEFFQGMLPYVDLDSGGNAVQLAANIRGLIDGLPEGAKVIPGHGELSSVEEFRRYLDMLEATVGYVRGEVERGRTLEQIQKAGLPEKWKPWATRFVTEEKWIAAIHASLKNEID